MKHLLLNAQTIKNKISKIGLFVLLTFHFTMSGQETGEAKLGAWYMYFGTLKLSEDLSIHNEAQFRFYDLGSNFNQLLLRAGLNFHMNQSAILTAGYAYIDTDPTYIDSNDVPQIEMGRNIPEHRIFEQFIKKHKIASLQTEHRFRLEQRFLTPGDTRETEHRTRYRLQLTQPLGKQFFINFYDEIFVNLQHNWFGQNRLFLALGKHINQNLSLQFGYLRNNFSETAFNRLQLALFWNTDLRKNR
ncbi:MAG: hypothetical protein RLZZ241_1181 [Bacteroidota bacterium]|jgi:hypothetical protein